MDHPVVEHQPDRLAFANTFTANNRDCNQITCFECGQTGHVVNRCPNCKKNEYKKNDNPPKADAPKADQEGTNLCTHGVEDTSDGEFSFYQVNGYNIPIGWVLLDNQSTIDVFCNKKLL
jgi:Zinc knuckle